MNLNYFLSNVCENHEIIDYSSTIDAININIAIFKDNPLDADSK